MSVQLRLVEHGRLAADGAGLGRRLEDREIGVLLRS